MAELEKKAKVINKSGTLKMTDEVAATRQTRDIAGRKMERRGGGRRRGRGREDRGPKEFEEVTINIDRVSRTVKGGRRMRFKALVAIGNRKNKVGIGVAKGSDVTTAVQKATTKAKKTMITFPMDGETICHEVETKATGAHVLMKPAAPGTGIIAGGVVRSIIGLTGVKNMISKSLGSTNKVNIAYAVIEGLRQQTPRSAWINAKDSKKVSKKPADKREKVSTPKTTRSTKKSTEVTTKKTSTQSEKKTVTKKKPATKSSTKEKE